jgi:hypothetical protein
MAEMKLNTKTALYPADLRNSSTTYLAPAISLAVIIGAPPPRRNSTFG